MDNNLSKNFQLKKLPKNTVEVEAVLLWSEIEKEQEKVLESINKEREFDGFRKGKAPLDIVRKNIDSEKLLKKTLEELLPDLYQKAISALGIKPIVTPKVELLSAKENSDWTIRFTVCEEPEVNLGNYKEEIKKIAKPAKIWTPDSKEEKPEQESEAKNKRLGEVLNTILAMTKVEIGDLVIEEEVNRKLSSLLEQSQKLGLTIEQYLSSTGKTIESLKKEYRDQVERSLALEFILGKIADEEKIEVNPEEIEKMVSENSKDSKEAIQDSQKYYLALLLRRQKTLDFLTNL